MGKVMVRELVLVLVTGFFGWLVNPYILQQPVAFPLFFVGLFLGITFMPMHGVALLVGRRLPPAVRAWAGVFAWFFAFLANIKTFLMILAGGGTPAALTTVVALAPPLLGLLLPALAALRAPARDRVGAAAWALYLYALPMWVVQDVLVRIVRQSPVLPVMALMAGTLYMFLHGILRILKPSAAEDEARTEPLRERRAVPDAIVGLVEGTLHRPARPYATTAAGLDDSAISVLCKPGEVESALERLAAALGDRPFRAERGTNIKDRVEIVIRQRN